VRGFLCGGAFFFLSKTLPVPSQYQYQGEEIGKEGKEGPTQDLKTPFYELLIKAPRFNLWR